MKRLLLREALEQPLLLIFEDLHWIDGETQARLDGLVEGLGSARLLLLVTHRPEHKHGWGSKTSYGQMPGHGPPAQDSPPNQALHLTCAATLGFARNGVVADGPGR